MLSVLSKIYGRVMDVRNGLYNKGVFRTRDLRARTISIGNITTGGTGKTPLVAYVADILAARGETVCILTRGYGRKDAKKRVLVSDGTSILANVATAGDEPVELAQKLLGKAIVVADADRVAAAEWAKQRFGVTAFVLDDGFQHRRAGRNLDIICIDATNPGGNSQAGSLRFGRMLPAGRLREPLSNLSRADAIVITRSDLVDDISDLRSEISELAPEAKIFVSSNSVVNRESLLRKPAFAFCALGNPEAFFETLRRGNADLVGERSFPDHYVYTQTDVDQVESASRKAGAELLVTTAKDAVKLSDLKFEMPWVVVEIDVKIDDADAFVELLAS